MSETKATLFSEFPPGSTEAWMEKITADRKGADFEKKLVWKTNEGFNVRPFYRSEDIQDLKTITSPPGEFPFVRGTGKNNDWYVRQDIETSDVEAANKKALDILNKGINSLGFDIPRNLVSAENINILLAGIHAESVELNFKTCACKSPELVKGIVACLKSKSYDLTKCAGSVNMDFIGPILREGCIVEDAAAQMAEAVNASRELRMFRVIGVNAYLFNNAGSYITQELGYALAWGNDVLAKLIEKGVDPSLAAKKIKFNFGTGSNYFMEIAKFRAARLLWAKIVNAYAPKCLNPHCPCTTKEGICRCASKMNIFAQTSTFNQTIYDAHVNLLRTQTEAMSAGIAGVDSLLISPFDQSYKTPDDFSERIARNQQLLLKEEAHFDKVVDASGGSYYIETLTHSIAQQAWKIFLETEEKGFYQMLTSGEIQKAVNASAEARFKALAQRREVLLGTNQYPNFTEKAVQKIEDSACKCGCGKPFDTSIETLNRKRLSSEFETLRLATEQSGKTPKAFMLTIGNLAMRLARSQFSCNFLACAGYQVIDNLGFETVEAGIKAARDAGADIIVLCSSDDEYAKYAPEAYQLIEDPHNPPKAGKKEIFIVAGAPACMDDLKAQGITNYINVRSNVLETLKAFNEKLGIK
ncbi:MAG: methylmalonyl-CoA mutase small subunit [Dysgonamonadaceae bacterium]|jgi:methylmalonyl-CoA mutase|nr:methylmalonyl-CoA mutase small subunit [Dysgonamonadaceae bacterium]